LDETPHVPITTSSVEVGTTPPTHVDPEVQSIEEDNCAMSNWMVTAAAPHIKAATSAGKRIHNLVRDIAGIKY
jgi:hypothetical protein